MFFECQKCPINMWIKLQQSASQENFSIERIQRSLVDQNQDDKQKTIQNTITNNPNSSSYISSIFSLQKVPKKSSKQSITNTNRLLYHNYNKYKTVPFSYEKIFLPKQYSSTLVNDLSNQIFDCVVKSKRNFCFFTFGSKQSDIQTLIEGSQAKADALFYSSVVKIHDLIERFNKSSEFQNGQKVKSTINFFAISQNKITDLLNISNQIHLKQNAHNAQAIYSKPLRFENATDCSFTSNYELYTTFKRTLFKIKQLKAWGVFIVKLNFSIYDQNSRDSAHEKSALLVEWVKESHNIFSQSPSYQRNKSSGCQKSLLCLNQCILQILKLIQIRINRKIPSETNQTNNNEIGIYEKQQLQKLSNLQCFRNSLIARVLKPYLLFDTQFLYMACCSISQENQNESYQSLMLGKHLSKLHSLVIIKQMESLQFGSKNEKDISQHSQNDEQYHQTHQLKPKPQRTQKLNDSRNVKVEYKSLDSSPKKKQLSSYQNDEIKDNSKQQVSKSAKLRQKLMDLLQQSKQKQRQRNSEENEMGQISKKFFQQKAKSLKIKKQLNMLKVKSKTKILRNNVLEKYQNETQLIEQQIKRLNFDEKKLEKELEKLQQKVQTFIQSDKKSVQGETKSQQKQEQPQKIKIKKLRLLKKQLKNQLSLTELQIDEYLEEKQSIKSIYMSQIALINKQEQLLIKKVNNVKDQKKKFNFRADHKDSFQKIRLIKEMEPLKPSLPLEKQRNMRSLDFNRNHRYSKDFGEKIMKRYSFQQKNTANLVKSFDKNKRTIKDPFQTNDQSQKIKKSRLLMKKRSQLKQKLQKGRVDYISFLEEATKKYIDYNPKRRQSTK